MALTWPVVLAVLCGALLHAGWNAFVKASDDKALEMVLLHLLGGVVAVPLLLWFGLPRAQAWPYLLASMGIHFAYYIAVVGAYKHGDLGLTYPVMRGFAPLLVALCSVAFIGETPSPGSWLGIIAISVGVALVGLAHRGNSSHVGKALAFALANAAIIAAYTLVDGLGVRASADAARYVLLLFVFDGIPYALLVWWQRSPAQRRAMLVHARRRWPVASLGGLASLGSYGIALWAMTRAPVASVAALRETSVLFAALLGTWLLKEPFGVQRALGTAVIVAGVMALRMG